MEEGEDNQDELAELAKSAVACEKLPVLLPVYSVSEGRLAYNGNGTKLQIYSQTQKWKVMISSLWLSYSHVPAC